MRKLEGYGEGLPIGRGFEKLPSIQRQPCMPFEMLIQFHDSAVEFNRKPGAARKQKQCQGAWETIAFGIVGEHGQPTIRVVSRILYDCFPLTY